MNPPLEQNQSETTSKNHAEDFSEFNAEDGGLLSKRQPDDLAIQNSQVSSKKRERRSKEQATFRNYVCGCGKTYLSYAALYTHAKTKHDSIFPEGTATLSKKKGPLNVNEPPSVGFLNSDYQKMYDFNREFQKFLGQVPDAKDDSAKKHKNLIDFFPCENFYSEECYRPVLVSLEQIRQEMKANYGSGFLSQIDSIICEISNAKKLNCNQVFALFLLYAFRFVSKTLYRDLVFILIIYRKMLNEFGWEKLKKLNEQAEFDSTQEFCEANNAELIPQFANKFIVDYFLEYLNGPKAIGKGDSLVYFGPGRLKLLFAIVIVKFFCQWLCIHRLSKAKIDI